MMRAESDTNDSRADDDSGTAAPYYGSTSGTSIPTGDHYPSTDTGTTTTTPLTTVEPLRPEDALRGAPPMTGNYLHAGDIKGYCFALEVVDNVERTEELSSLSLAYSLPGTSWDDYAVIGCNLNQDEAGGDGSELDFSTAGSGGICIYGSNFSRLEIRDAQGLSWCSDVGEGGGCASWSEFNTECWEGGRGSDFTPGAPIQQALAKQSSLSDGVDVHVKPKAATMTVSSFTLQ